MSHALVPVVHGVDYDGVAERSGQRRPRLPRTRRRRCPARLKPGRQQPVLDSVDREVHGSQALSNPAGESRLADAGEATDDDEHKRG